MIKIIGRMLALSGRRRSKLILSFFVNFLESIMGFVPVVVAYLSFSWLQADAMSTGRIRLIAVALAAAVLLRYAFKLLEFNLQSGVGYEVMCDERLSLGKRLLRLSLGFYQDSDAGRISSILNDDLVFIEDTATAFISKTVGAIFGAIGMAAFMFVTDWRVALVACVGYPLAGIANHFIKRHMTACSALRQQAHAEASSAMLEHLRGIFVIKTFGLDGAQGTRLRRALRNLEVVSCDLEMGALP